MTSLREVERALASAEIGSAELDGMVALLIHPDRRLVLFEGAPHWEMAADRAGDSSLAGRTGPARMLAVPWFSRSIDAGLPWESILRVERIDGFVPAWRAWQAEGLFADGRTEALARRLAALCQARDHLVFDSTPHRRRRREARKTRGLPAPPPAPELAHEIEALQRAVARLEARLADGTGRVLRAVSAELDELRRSLETAARPAPVAAEMIPQAAPDPVPAPNAAPPLARPPPVATICPMLSEVAARWLQDTEQTAGRSSSVRHTVRRFTEFNGDLPVDRFTRNHVWSFMQAMRRMPRNPLPEDRRLSLPLLLERAKDDPTLAPISPLTQRTHLDILVNLFRYAQNLDLRPDNPADTVTHRIVHADRRPRKPYDAADLQLIFHQSPLYTGCKSTFRRKRPGDQIIRDGLFWLPLISLFSGARLGELICLSVDDVTSELNIPYLDVNARVRNKSVKSRYAIRRVPLHPELVRCGLLHHVEAVREAGTGLLFTLTIGETVNRRIRISQNWSSKWRALSRAMGLVDSDKTFHSFRHSFKRALRAARVDQDIQDALMGHAQRFSAAFYGGDMPLEILAEAVGRIAYPGLDLAHLHVEGAEEA